MSTFRDIELLKNLICFFNCGRYVQSPNKKWGYYESTKFADNFEIIKTFFDKYPVRGVKHNDYLDWIEIGEMINKKQHLTKQGVTKIMQIKSNMELAPQKGYLITKIKNWFDNYTNKTVQYPM